MIVNRNAIIEGLLDISNTIVNIATLARHYYNDNTLSDEKCFAKSHADIDKVNDQIRDLLCQTGASLRFIYPNIVEDIDSLLEDEQVLSNSQYDTIINEVLNMDYSDYNENIKEIIGNVLSERRN